MPKLGCLPATLAAGFLFTVGYSLYITIRPATEVVVLLPMRDSRVRIQSWAYFINPEPYVLIVDSPAGSIKVNLWTDWVPAGTANLYTTPENWLAVLGGAGSSVIIDVTNPLGPREISHTELPRKNDEEWTYLGKVIVGGGFLDASKSTECFEMLGAGYSPYRKRFQVEHFCIEPLQSQR